MIVSSLAGHPQGVTEEVLLHRDMDLQEAAAIDHLRSPDVHRPLLLLAGMVDAPVPEIATTTATAHAHTPDLVHQGGDDRLRTPPDQDLAPHRGGKAHTIGVTAHRIRRQEEGGDEAPAIRVTPATAIVAGVGAEGGTDVGGELRGIRTGFRKDHLHKYKDCSHLRIGNERNSMHVCKALLT